MKVFCPALLSGRFLPARSAHSDVPGGQNISPPVLWSGVPPATQSFVLTLVDVHAIPAKPCHWFVKDIPFFVRELAEKVSGSHGLMPAGSLELRNSFGVLGFTGPKLPRGSNAHTYELTVFALSERSLQLGPYSSDDERSQVLAGCVLGQASLSMEFRP